MAKKPLPPEILALIERYQKSQIKLIDIIANTEAKGNSAAYRKQILASVNAELDTLNKFAVKWVNDEIPKAYNKGVDEAYEVYRAANIPIGAIATNQEVLKNLVNNTIGQLTDANQYVGRRIADDLRQAGIEAITEKLTMGNTVKQTKAILLQKMSDKGITAITDSRGRGISLDSYASMVARTTTREATNKGTLQTVKDMGEDLVQISQHFSSCPICSVYEGRVYSVSGDSKDYPPLSEAFSEYDSIHPNCFVSGTPVLARGVVAHSSRDYIGEVATIKISGSDNLTVTPNHPILTSKGWVAAGSLLKGDKIVKYTALEDFILRHDPNDINIETAIENVPHTIGKSLSVSTHRMETTTKQFHGDGTNGKVAVINTYRLLGSKFISRGSKKVRKHDFVDRCNPRSFLNTFSTLAQIINGSLRPTHSIMSRFSEFLSFFDSQTLHSDAGRFRPATCGHDTHTFKPIVNSHISNAEMKRNMMLRYPSVIHIHNFVNRKINDVTAFLTNYNRPQIAEPDTLDTSPFFKECDADTQNGRDLLNSLSGKIEFLNVVDVTFKFFHGKVFNLQTNSKWFLANSIITHNCTHNAIPYLRKYDENAEQRQADSNRPFEIDKSKKASIEAYNKDQAIKAARRVDRKEWQAAKALAPNEAPKTFSGYRSIKRADNQRYKDLKAKL